MNEKWNRSNKRSIIMAVFMLVFGVIMFIVLFFNLFGFTNALVKGSSIEIADMRLYGEIFCAFTIIIALSTILRKRKEDPDKIFVKSLARYANTTQYPEATLERLKKTWESGEQLRDWCRMDDEYIIECVNGPCYANVIPVQEVVWAYKTITRVDVVIKTDTSLMVRYANHQSGSISISENTVDYILQRFMEKNCDIVVGHNRDVEKLYLKKDMEGLKEYARQQRMGIG